MASRSLVLSIIVECIPPEFSITNHASFDSFVSYISEIRISFRLLNLTFSDQISDCDSEQYGAHTYHRLLVDHWIAFHLIFFFFFFRVLSLMEVSVGKEVRFSNSPRIGYLSGLKYIILHVWLFLSFFLSLNYKFLMNWLTSVNWRNCFCY